MRNDITNRHCLSVKQRDDVNSGFEAVLCKYETAVKVRTARIDDCGERRFEMAFEHRDRGNRKVAIQLLVTCWADGSQAAVKLC